MRFGMFRFLFLSIFFLIILLDLKLKEAAKAFGKKFSSGASISDTNAGGKEVVIQGDVSYDLPAMLINNFKVPADRIYFLEDGSLRPYE